MYKILDYYDRIIWWLRKHFYSFKDGDVILSNEYELSEWNTSGILVKSPFANRWVVWNLCPAGWIAGCTLTSLSTKRFRLATRSERKVLLHGMLDAPFEDPSDDPITARNRELWEPIYESTLRPVIESIRE